MRACEKLAEQIAKENALYSLYYDYERQIISTISVSYETAYFMFAVKAKKHAFINVSNMTDSFNFEIIREVSVLFENVVYLM